MRIIVHHKNDTFGCGEFINAVRDRIMEKGKFEELDLISCLDPYKYKTEKWHMNMKITMNEWRRIISMLESVGSKICLYNYIIYCFGFKYCYKCARGLCFIPGDEELFFDFVKHVANYAEGEFNCVEDKIHIVMQYTIRCGFGYLKNDVRRYALMRFGYEAKIN